MPQTPPLFTEDLCLPTIWMAQAHGCLITVHLEASPTDEDWRLHVDYIQRMVERGQPFMTVLYSLGGFANHTQRSTLIRMLKDNPGIHTHGVILNDALIVRMAIRAIRIVDKGIRSVPRDDIEGALAHLGHPMDTDTLRAIIDHGLAALRHRNT